MGRHSRYERVIHDFVWSPGGSGELEPWTEEATAALAELLIQSDEQAKAKRKADRLVDEGWKRHDSMHPTCHNHTPHSHTWAANRSSHPH